MNALRHIGAGALAGGVPLAGMFLGRLAVTNPGIASELLVGLLIFSVGAAWLRLVWWGLSE